MIENNEIPSTVKPYRLGLALSGGGARGFAHAGAIKALEEMELRPDVISGVSAGSVIGALYADGYTPDEIIDMFGRLSVSDLAEITVPRSSFFKITKFRNFLKKVLRSTNFEDLSIPLVITTTDLDNGRCVSFSSGPLLDVICASCSIPVLFSPVNIEGVHYVDGGVFRNFPVTPIRSSCDVIIGVNVNPLVAKEYKQSIIDIAERSYSFIFKSNSIIDSKLCDILIQTNEIIQYNIFDIDKLREIARYGYQDTKEALLLKRESRSLEIIRERENKD